MQEERVKTRSLDELSSPCPWPACLTIREDFERGRSQSGPSAQGILIGGQSGKGGKVVGIRRHTSYLSREPRVHSCKIFLAGVNFYRFSVKNWQFTVYFAVITQKIGNLLCILS